VFPLWQLTEDRLLFDNLPRRLLVRVASVTIVSSAISSLQLTRLCVLFDLLFVFLLDSKVVFSQAVLSKCPARSPHFPATCVEFKSSTAKRS